MTSATILALDFGAKRIGCALRKKDTEVVFPWGILQNDKNVFNVLRVLVEKEDVETIVVGMPFSLEGGESRAYRKVIDFVAILKKELSVPIETIDERFTTQEALRDSIEFGASVDERAAQLILEMYDRRHAHV